MRATTLLNRLLNLEGVNVVGLDLEGVDHGRPVRVQVKVRRRVLVCPHCAFRTPAPV